ncbi:MAG: N-acetyltransferase [Pyrinomonadaceae bacterium]|nr:N-acetyltransferase [Pyrinomonadaceae bacterium]
MSFIIDKMGAEDWEQVRVIYLEGIATGHATFETQAPEWEVWDARHLPYSRLVARDGETVKGWAALSAVSSRFVYAGVAEISVYVGQSYRGEGIGKALLEALVSESERNGIWSLQAGIFPENSYSITMHKQCGFREVGRRERIGRMNGIWRDVALLERRSEIVGAD